jgi:hypothetical protein
MIRTVLFVSAFLLAICATASAQDRQLALLAAADTQRSQHRLDGELSRQEYQEIYRRNQKYLRNTLKRYSRNALGLVGMPEQTADLMGAALGYVTRGAKLNLNESKTLRIEFRDVENQDRAVYFGVNLDW